MIPFYIHAKDLERIELQKMTISEVDLSEIVYYLSSKFRNHV